MIHLARQTPLWSNQVCNTMLMWESDRAGERPSELMTRRPLARRGVEAARPSARHALHQEAYQRELK